MDQQHRQMKDPAAGVPAQLLPHFHLISKHRYPVVNNPSLDALVQYLLEAPRIMREGAPVQWQVLDAPPDGSMFLTWQPLEYLNTNFGSDGYIWGDPETTFNSEIRGYTLQMFWHRTGYKPQAEAVATHSRRRYRLLPSNQQMGLPQSDPALFLVHYSKAEQRNQHPAASIQVLPMVQQQFQQRRMIQAGGQLPRKEFMLNDRPNWPIINAPGARPGSGGQIAAGHRRGQSLAHEVTLEEEEDVSRGDALDFMTPRDISRMRYEQHHEWMEEILESPYGTKQIVPPDLGLGRKGALESLTNSFFTAPMTIGPESVTGGPVKVGKMDPGKAEEFTKLANQRLLDMQAELEKMKQQHIKRMEKLRRTTELSAAERKLRPTNGGMAGNETIENVSKEVEDLVGKKIDQVSNVSVVSKGGLQYIQPIISPTPVNGSSNGSVGPKQTSPQVQQPTTQAGQELQSVPPAGEQQSGVLSTDNSTPLLEEGVSKAESMTGNEQTPGSLNSPGAPTNELPDLGDELGDVEMDGLVEDAMPTEDNEVDTGDWNMVGNDQVADAIEEKQEIPDVQDAPEEKAEKPPMAAVSAVSQLNVPAANTPVGTNDFDMVNDFDTPMDTAGDALADYGADDDLGLDDSAFGDAFHHHDQEDDLS